MNAMSFALPSNVTYAIRTAVWQPATDKIGVLEVHESRDIRSKKPPKVKVRRYAVLEETDPKVHRGLRIFKLTKPGGTEWYRCRIAPHAIDHDSCECNHGQRDVSPCTHLQCLRALLGRGEFRPAEAPACGPRAAVHPPGRA